jgi:hypothetical protein
MVLMDGTSPSVAEVPVRFEFKKMNGEEAQEIAILGVWGESNSRRIGPTQIAREGRLTSDGAVDRGGTRGKCWTGYCGAEDLRSLARPTGALPTYQTCHRRFQAWVRDGTLKRA